MSKCLLCQKGVFKGSVVAIFLCFIPLDNCIKRNKSLSIAPQNRDGRAATYSAVSLFFFLDALASFDFKLLVSQSLSHTFSGSG